MSDGNSTASDSLGDRLIQWAENELDRDVERDAIEAVERDQEAARLTSQCVDARVADVARVAVAPEPTPLVRPTLPAPPYPIDALGPVLAPAGRAIAEIVQVPHALAASSVLATAALAASPHGDVQTLGGVRPLSLYLLLVAGSGDRKSAADRVARMPIDQHVRRALLIYRTQLAEWQRVHAARKLDRTKARKEAESGDDYAAALTEIADEPPPRKPWIVCSEPTIEGMVVSLRDGQLAQGIFTDEGGQLIGGHAMSEESQLRTVAMLSRLWQGDPIDRVRATDAEHVILYGRRLCLHLLAQPAVAARMLGSQLCRAQGFLARWLVAAPESLAGTRLHDPKRPAPDKDPRIVRYWHAIGQLLESTPVEDHELGGLSPPSLALSPEARQLLVTAYDEIECAQARGAELETVRDWASKAAEHACRIAGVMTLAANPGAISVSVETMRDALTLTQYYLGEFRRLAGSAGVTEEIERAQLLLEWVRTKGHVAITPRRIMQFGPGSIRSADVARSALRTLAEHGWVRTDDGRTYAVHPAVHHGAHS